MLYNETLQEKICPVCRQRHTDGTVKESIWKENYPMDETAYKLFTEADESERKSICFLCDMEMFENYLQKNTNFKMQELEHKYAALLENHRLGFQIKMHIELDKQKENNYVGLQITQKEFIQMLNQTINSLISIKDELKEFTLKQNSMKAFVKSKWKNQLAEKKKGKKK